MREFKFRGKRKDSGEWAVGSLTVEFDGTCHINYWVNKLIEPENNYSEPVHEMVEVVPESVGIWTGAKGMNDKDFYEGDIIRSRGGITAFIEWNTKWACFHMPNGHGFTYTFTCGDDIEVIGNIHDNPELLNPLADSPAINNMLDPNVKAEEVKDDAAAIAPAEQATEAGNQGAQAEGVGALVD